MKVNRIFDRAVPKMMNPALAERPGSVAFKKACVEFCTYPLEFDSKG